MSAIRARGRSAGAANQSSFIRRVPAPRPRNVRPLASRSACRIADAWTNGDLAKAYATPVPTRAVVVDAAISASDRYALLSTNSPVQNAPQPADSAARPTAGPGQRMPQVIEPTSGARGTARRHRLPARVGDRGCV